MHKKLFPTIILVALLVALFSSISSADKPTPERTTPGKDNTERAPVLLREGRAALPNQFIVVFKKGTDQKDVQASLTALSKSRSVSARVSHTYNSALNGFAATLNDKAVEMLQNNPNVAYIEQDGIVSIDVTWGLDRIDQRNLPLDNSYSTAYPNLGSGVHAYIIDTGIRTTHNEFSGRVGNGYDYVDNDSDPSDCNGHGTHVSGTVAGSTYGVAPNATVHGVRVLDCNGSGSYANVIAGIDWVTSNHSSPAVANMSLGGGASTSVDNAVNNSVAAGVTYAVAAGNDNANACNYSPARAVSAITVGSTTSSDARSSFSNYGTCLDIFAPGSSITSAWYTSNSATNTISGTSMASPHVAGAAALYLGENPGASPSQVTNALTGNATANVISSAGSGSPNLLLYVGGSGGGNPTPTPPPNPTATPTPNPGNCNGILFNDYLSNSEAHYYTYSGSTDGSHAATLEGPGSADFDLALQKKVWWWWSSVSVSESPSSSESISYYGSSGQYRWKVYAYSGSGNYDFCVTD